MKNNLITHLFNGGLVVLFIVAGIAFFQTDENKQNKTVEIVQIDNYTVTITSN